MADGASFQIDVGVQAAGAESAAVSLERLTQQLTDAGKASEAASAALSAGEASYQQAETSADRAAKALERIGLAVEAQKGKLQAALDVGDVSGIESASSKLQALMSRQSEAASRANAAKSALDQEAEALDRLKSAASDAISSEEALQKAQEEATSAAEEALDAEEASDGTGSARKTAAGLEALGGPLGRVGAQVFRLKEGWSKLSESLGDAGPEVGAAVVLVALAAAVAAVTAAVIIGLAKITAWGVGLADVARSNGLLAAGIAKSVAGGALLDKKLSDLENRVPQTRDELQSMAQQLAATGLSGQALTDALEKNAIAAAKLKFGPEWEKEMNSLPQLQKRLKSGFDSLFSGLKIDKLLEQLGSLVDLFSTSESSGRAIKTVFESLFQPLVDGATDMVPKIRAAFLQFEIMVLKALIAIKPWGSKIKLAAEIIGVLALAIGIGLALAIGILVVGIAMMGVAIGVLVALVVGLIAGMVWLAATIFGAVGQAIDWLKAKFVEAKAWLANLSLSDLGAKLIDGLVDGIKSNALKVLTIIKSTVTGAIDGAKKLLGIASPSKVFMDIGAQTGAGMAMGVDKTSDDVQDSLTSMVAPPSAPALEGIKGGKAGAPAASGKGGANLQGATFNFYGVEGAEDAEARFGELLTKIVEGDAAQLGSAVPG